MSTPENIAGREVIWVEDERDGKLIAHESGLLNLAYATLDPTGDRAMEDNLYPITEIGMINLVEQLIRRGELLADHDLTVSVDGEAKVGDRDCRVIRIELLSPHDTLDFKVAEISMDAERQLPLRYVAYAWPEEGSDRLPVMEEYTYLNVETNVGLTKDDFDPANEQYQFPSVALPIEL